jgi:hypothetical protein
MAVSIVPTAGLAAVASAFSTAVLTPFIAIGTNATTPAATDTEANTLTTQQDRNAVTTTTVSGASVTYEAFFSTSEPTTSQTITDVRLLNASTVGTLLVRGLLTTALAKTTNKTMLVTIAITFANA